MILSPQVLHTHQIDSCITPSDVRILVYTLWKKHDLLPWISTPASVIPIIVGGADLMIPGGKYMFLSIILPRQTSHDRTST